jgi:multidrug resistance efflux pump
VTVAEVMLSFARKRLQRARVVAPTSGVVIARSINPGETVVGGASLFQIADTSRTEARVELEEADAMRVEPGLVVTLTSMTGDPVGSGRVVRVSPRVERRAITVDPASVRGDGLVRAAWIQWTTDPRLPLGQRLEAAIELPSRQVAARVPRSAVHVRNGVAKVVVARGPLREERAVRLGIADPEYVEVHGISLGEIVVVGE